MNTRPVVHGSFAIHRTYNAPVGRVFAAWADLEMKARWFIGPPDRWKLLKRSLDFRVGGTELLQGEFNGAHKTTFVAHYHEIIPNERLVYAYEMYVGEKYLSVSLATVEFSKTASGGTRMTFTEQAAFLDGEDGTKSREEGTAAHFDRLASALDDPRDIVSDRVFEAPREAIYQAFSDPQQLAGWWGPKGFTNTFQTFDLRPGGTWRFVMRTPDGNDIPLEKEFVEVSPDRVILLHPNPPEHRFAMTMTFTDLGPRTHVVWRIRFDREEEARKVHSFIAGANEENFDRLAAHLAQK